MRRLLRGVTAVAAACALEIGLTVAKWILVLLALGVAVGIVWGLNEWLGAPGYLILVAVPLAVVAVWPLARLIDRLDGEPPQKA